MKQMIRYVGLDVDDTQHHGSSLNKTTGKFIDFKCRPTKKKLLCQLEKFVKHFSNSKIKLCDESSYIGY